MNISYRTKPELSSRKRIKTRSGSNDSGTERAKAKKNQPKKIKAKGVGAKIQKVKVSLRNALENISEVLAGKLLLPLSRHGHVERREITWNNFSDRWLSYQKLK